MRINELLIESPQLDEGPFTQAIGKVGGKIAKGVANIGKDLKTGFKAGYSGEQPPADAAATSKPTTTDPAASTAAATTQTAPVKKAAPVATATEPAPAAAKDGEGVTKLTQQVASLTTDLQGLVQTMNADKRDMLTDISNLKQQVAKLVKPSQAEIDNDGENNPNIQRSNNSVIRTEPSLSETLARKVQEQRQRMFETALMSGTQSVFKK